MLAGFGVRMGSESRQCWGPIEEKYVETSGVEETWGWISARRRRPEQAQSFVTDLRAHSASHDELMPRGNVREAFGKIATFTIWPC